MFDSLKERLASFYGGLNEREQMLVKIAGVVLPLVLLTIVGLLVDRSLDSVRRDIDKQKQLLTLLGDVAPQYQQQKEKSGADKKSAKFSPERLEKNKVKLTSFVATHATAVGVQVDSYDETERPIGSDTEDEKGPSLYKLQVSVEIREAAFDKLLKLLERIEMASEPVVIERITLSEKRRKKGKVRATLIVTTFKRKAKG